MSERRKEKQEKLTCPSPSCRSSYSTVLPRKLEQGEGGYRRHRRCDVCGTEYETVEAIAGIIKHKAA